MTLYTKNGSYPAPLPHEIRLSDGFLRTDTSSFTPEEIADAGYVEAPELPAFDPATEVLGWDGENWTVEPLRPATDDVNVERDRRINGGFDFSGVRYQSGADDRENITGAAVAALAAITAGALPGDLRWHGGESDFMWIAEDNSVHPMDAQTVFAFGQAAMAHKQAHIFTARTIKDMDPIPPGYTDDAYWP